MGAILLIATATPFDQKSPTAGPSRENRLVLRGLWSHVGRGIRVVRKHEPD